MQVATFLINQKLNAAFRHVGSGKSSHLPAAYLIFKKGCIGEMKTIWGNNPPLNCPVSVKCLIPHQYRGDLVNYYKGLEDCLVTSGVLEDDNPEIVTSIAILRGMKEGFLHTLIEVLW
jgi:Holliday junction resolvase RusA-like endonuclease